MEQEGGTHGGHDTPILTSREERLDVSGTSPSPARDSQDVISAEPRSDKEASHESSPIDGALGIVEDACRPPVRAQVQQQWKRARRYRSPHCLLEPPSEKPKGGQPLPLSRFAKRNPRHPWGRQMMAVLLARLPLQAGVARNSVARRTMQEQGSLSQSESAVRLLLEGDDDDDYYREQQHSDGGGGGWVEGKQPGSGDWVTRRVPLTDRTTDATREKQRSNAHHRLHLFGRGPKKGEEHGDPYAEEEGGKSDGGVSMTKEFLSRKNTWDGADDLLVTQSKNRKRLSWYVRRKDDRTSSVGEESGGEERSKRTIRQEEKRRKAEEQRRRREEERSSPNSPRKKSLTSPPSSLMRALGRSPTQQRHAQQQHQQTPPQQLQQTKGTKSSVRLSWGQALSKKFDRVIPGGAGAGGAFTKKERAAGGSAWSEWNWEDDDDGYSPRA